MLPVFQGANFGVLKTGVRAQTCHKQYKTAAELETHLSSYDHHHKKACFPVAACPVGA